MLPLRLSDVRFLLGMVLSLKGQIEKELKEEKRSRGGRERGRPGEAADSKIKRERESRTHVFIFSA
jgi:hypothetical protein